MNEIYLDLLNNGKRYDLASQTTNEKVQLLLIRREDRNLLQCLAKNPNITPKVQNILVKNKDKAVRMELAKNLNITEKIRKILIKDKESEIRQQISNKLEYKLAQSTKKLIKQVQYSYSNDYELLMHLAKNSFLDIVVQQILIDRCEKHDIPNASLFAREKILCELVNNPALSEKKQLEVLCKGDSWCANILANNPTITETVQEVLIKQYSCSFEALATNPNLTPKMQKILCQNGSYDVWRKLAQRTDVTEEVQELLLAKEYEILIVSLLLNPNLSQNIKERLLSDKRWSDFLNRLSNQKGE